MVRSESGRMRTCEDCLLRMLWTLCRKQRQQIVREQMLALLTLKTQQKCTVIAVIQTHRKLTVAAAMAMAMTMAMTIAMAMLWLLGLVAPLKNVVGIVCVLDHLKNIAINYALNFLPASNFCIFNL